MTRNQQAAATRKKWQKICEAWAASGLSAREYCKKKKVSRSKFLRWRKKLNFPFLSNYREIAACKKWQKICEGWAASGLSATRYCKEKKVIRSEFFRWRKKINFPFFKKSKRIIHGWDKIIEDWEKSNLSVRKYCMENNISSTSLYKRRREMNHPACLDVQGIPNKWRTIIKDWEMSGLTIRVYSREKGLNAPTLHYWDKKFNSHKPKKTIQEKAIERWTKIFEEWQMSGLPGLTYCQRKRINPSSFQKWKKKLNDSENSLSRLDFTRQEHSSFSLEDCFASISFSSAVLMGSPPPDTKIDIMLSQGHQLSMEGPLDSETLNLWLTPLLSLGGKEKGNDHGKKTI